MHSRSRWHRAAVEGRPRAGGAIRPVLPKRDRGLPSTVWTKEVTGMARQSQGSGGWPTILWIAWREGETERREPLCRHHREQVFKKYPASVHGLGRSGDRCSICHAQPRRSAPATSTGRAQGRSTSRSRGQGLEAADLANPAQHFLSPGLGAGVSSGSNEWERGPAPPHSGVVGFCSLSEQNPDHPCAATPKCSTGTGRSASLAR